MVVAYDINFIFSFERLATKMLDKLMRRSYFEGEIKEEGDIVALLDRDMNHIGYVVLSHFLPIDFSFDVPTAESDVEKIHIICKSMVEDIFSKLKGLQIPLWALKLKTLDNNRITGELIYGLDNQ